MLDSFYRLITSCLQPRCHVMVSYVVTMATVSMTTSTRPARAIRAIVETGASTKVRVTYYIFSVFCNLKFKKCALEKSVYACK